MLHERFDIDKFKGIFPLAQLRKTAREFVLARQLREPSAYADASAVEKHIRLMEPHGESITGPYDVAVVEQLREEAFKGGKRPDQTPADVFAFARGEPTDPRSTKIGGLPFWPKQWNWPLTEDGGPTRFIAQFCFSDSQTNCGTLPGDVLALFGDPKDRTSDSLQCHWVESEGCIPMEQSEVPPVEQSLLPLYGVLHRTCDFAAYDERPSRYRRSDLLVRFEGTKIGGLPQWIQGEGELPGSFLCALGSVLPTARLPYPLVNVEAPFSFREQHDKRFLMWGDVGSVYFFFGDDGETRWTEQCY